MNSELIGDSEALSYLTGFPSITYYSPKTNTVVNTTLFSSIYTAIQN